MSAPQINYLNLEGEKITVNQMSKVLIMELQNKFNFAGRILNWGSEYSLEAFGINNSICNYVIKHQLKLMIRWIPGKTKIVYWINYDILDRFIKNNNCDYRVSAYKKIKNIPVNLFIEKPVIQGTK